MNWHERTVKATAREWLLDRVEPKENINYMGLPAADAIFERMLCNRYKVTDLDLYEKDVATFKILRANLASEEPDCYSYILNNEDIDEAIMNESWLVDLNFLWLDYCGPITPARLEVLDKSIKTIVARGGTVAVTYMAGREKANATALIEALDSESDLDVSSEGFVPGYFFKRIRVVCDVAIKAHPRLKISVLPYGDHVPMILFVFQKKMFGKTEITVESYLKE